MNQEVLETVVETPHESHEMWLSKRTSKMAGMIGFELMNRYIHTPRKPALPV